MQALDFNKNYFELFDIESIFEIDTNALHSYQQQLLARFHPDRFVTASEQEKRLSVQQASWINDAYQTLSNPVKRARYLLKISGLDVNDENETTSDAEFLMEQMTLREHLDRCRDDENPLEKCNQIGASLWNRARQLSEEFVQGFESGDFNAAQMTSRKMQFIQRIQEQVAELQFELEEELG